MKFCGPENPLEKSRQLSCGGVERNQPHSGNLHDFAVVHGSDMIVYNYQSYLGTVSVSVA